jgi:hypothetical protein
MPTDQPMTMTAPEIQAVADRLRSRGTSRNLVEEITALQDDAWLAARIIRTLLRHVSPSDVFNVYGPGGECR